MCHLQPPNPTRPLQLVPVELHGNCTAQPSSHSCAPNPAAACQRLIVRVVSEGVSQRFDCPQVAGKYVWVVVVAAAAILVVVIISIIGVIVVVIVCIIIIIIIIDSIIVIIIIIIIAIIIIITRL